MAVIEGKAYWASVSVPNIKFDPVYTINLVIDDQEAQEFAAKGFKVKQLEEGPCIVIKRKVTNKKGVKNSVPKLVNKDKEPMNELIGNGSRVRVQYKPWDVSNQFGDFQGLDLQAVQVLELVAYGDSSADGAELGIKEITSEEDEF